MIIMKKIIITILTLALIATVFASCTKTEIETTTYEPVIEFPTEEITSEEVTTETPTTMQEETTTEVPSTEEATTEAPTTEVPTTKEPETTTKAPVAETTTEKKPEVTTEKVTEENTTEAGPLKEFATPEPTTKAEEEDLNFIGGSTISPERAGLIYDGAGRLSSYDKIPEGSKYYEYDKNGVEHLKTKPYSKGNEPEPMRCEYCGKETKPYDGKHYGSYYGYCDRFLASMTCCECGEFVQANTCHTCK